MLGGVRHQELEAVLLSLCVVSTHQPHCLLETPRHRAQTTSRPASTGALTSGDRTAVAE